jgi:hypothetical protein
LITRRFGEEGGTNGRYYIAAAIAVRMKGKLERK